MIPKEEFELRLKDLRAVILDMDGVLVDTEPLHMEAFARYFERINFHYDQSFLMSLIGFSVPDNMRKVYQKLGNADPQVIAQAIKERDRIYQNLLRSKPLKPLPGIEPLIALCKQKGLKLALASSSDRKQIEIIFENLRQTSQGHFNPEEIFQAVVAGDEVSQRKPDPEIYLKACARVQSSPELCLAIEDSPAGVKSALQAGLTVVGLKTPFIEAKRLQQAHWLIDDINEIVPIMRKIKAQEQAAELNK